MIFWFIIGSAFWKLADYYGKNKWTYTLMGIGIAFVTQLLIGGIYGIMNPDSVFNMDSSTEMVLNLVGAAISGIIVYFVYKYLENKNIREEDDQYNATQNDIDEIGKDA